MKIGSDEQSTVQRREQQLITGAGGLYYVAKSFPDFLQWFIQQFQDVASRINNLNTTCNITQLQ